MKHKLTKLMSLAALVCCTMVNENVMSQTRTYTVINNGGGAMIVDSNSWYGGMTRHVVTDSIQLTLPNDPNAHTSLSIQLGTWPDGVVNYEDHGAWTPMDGYSIAEDARRLLHFYLDGTEVPLDSLNPHGTTVSNCTLYEWVSTDTLSHTIEAVFGPMYDMTSDTLDLTIVSEGAPVEITYSTAYAGVWVDYGLTDSVHIVDYLPHYSATDCVALIHWDTKPDTTVSIFFDGVQLPASQVAEYRWIDDYFNGVDTIHIDFYQFGVSAADGVSNVRIVFTPSTTDRFHISVMSSDNTLGQVEGGGDYFVNEGANLVFFALPYAGNGFMGWSDGATDNPRVMFATSDTSFAAVFVPISFVDTVWVYDTIHDTVYITDQGIDGVDALNAKVYVRQGQIVVEGADGNTVTLLDINGRMLATKQDDYGMLRFDIPSSGSYMIKIGNHPARRVVVIR